MRSCLWHVASTAWNNAHMLGTLGAAHAEFGPIDEAIRWMKQALAHENLPGDRAAEIAANLACVEERRPIRD